MDETFEQRWWRMNVESIADSIIDLKSKYNFIREKLKEFRQKFISNDASNLEKEILHQLSDLEKEIESNKKEKEQEIIKDLLAQIATSQANISSVDQLPPKSEIPETPVIESNSQKIARILEPLRNAFDNPSHIDTITNALVNLADDGTLPEKVNSKVKQLENKDFYPYFKQVHNETSLSFEGIATVLTYLICQPNSCEILPTTIMKNIKLNYPKL